MKKNVLWAKLVERVPALCEDDDVAVKTSVGAIRRLFNEIYDEAHEQGQLYALDELTEDEKLKLIPDSWNHILRSHLGTKALQREWDALMEEGENLLNNFWGPKK